MLRRSGPDIGHIPQTLGQIFVHYRLPKHPMRTYSNSGGGLVTPQWRGLWRQRRIGCSHLCGIDAASSHTCIAALLVWQEALIGR